ncbi:hypothetical protein GCM10022246_17660 [Pedobacter ginsengiterrae]|uniref:DUF1579 domain-containing protein n=2 Tax=Pedobacter ginsengiterrae TaxID=871696 RepID=A0ABP7PG63_9SPHI
MTMILLGVLGAGKSHAKVQNVNLMKQVELDNQGALKITPTSASSKDDFNFLMGKWTVKNRKLRSRLSGSKEWDEFDSVLELREILMGIGNRETFTATIGGKPYEAIALRLFNPKTLLWTDYWADSNDGILDKHPVVGSFEGKVGSFFTRDEFKGKAILVLYQWDYSAPDHPQWRQAYSQDNGAHWEWNWYMDLSRI